MCNSANKEMDQQTNGHENITSLAEVVIRTLKMIKVTNWKQRSHYLVVDMHRALDCGNILVKIQFQVALSYFVERHIS